MNDRAMIIAAMVHAGEQDPLIVEFAHELECCIIRHDSHRDAGRLTDELNALITPIIKANS